MARKPLAPLKAGWVSSRSGRMYHRFDLSAGPDAPALVHVHGFGVSGTYLEPTAIQLLDRARTFVPDLPGTGRSDRPNKPLDVPKLADAIVAYLDAIEVQRATFVGNSLGCIGLIELAASHPDRVEGLVLVSPAGGPNNQPLPRAVRQLMLDGVREPFAMSRIASRDYLRFGVAQSIFLFRAMTRYPVLDRIPLLEQPTLVIVGRRDPLVDAARVRSGMSVEPHVAVVRVEGAHALNFTHPEILSSLIRAHLDDEDFALAGDGRTSVEVLFDDRHQP